jgi:predicted permease
MSSDIRYAARRLAASPGFALTAILTVALGVGLNTGIFSVLNGAVFRDLPVPAAEALVVATQSVDGVPGRNEKGRQNPRFTTAELETYFDRSRTLAGLMGYSLPWPATLGGTAPQEIMGRYVTCGYFDVLRQPPTVGRALTADDCRAGAALAVVLSHAFWSRAYAADPAIVGSSITMNGHAFTVVGIAAADAYEPGFQKLDYYVPITAQPYLRPDRQWLVSNESGWLEIMGRRGDAISIAAVQAELGVIAAEIDRANPGRATTIVIQRAKPTSLGQLDGGLAPAALVVSVFGLVLLIACANVANLFLARALTRAPEIAVRRALGASRSRVVRQLLTESLLIAGAGGITGSVLAVISLEGLLRVLLSSSSIALPAIALDLRVLAFALALSLCTGVACGLAPALQASRSDLQAAARFGAPGSSRRDGWLRNVLIGVQVAACTVLLIGASLLLRGLHATHTADPGFPYRSVGYVGFELRGFGYGPDDIVRFQGQLADEIAALPGVAAVAFADGVPLESSNMFANVRVPDADEAAWQLVELNKVTPDYFSAVGIPIVLGRTFSEAEQTETATAVIVTESTARSLWPDSNPIGQTLARRVGPNEEALWEVVGVARDAQVSVIGQTPASYLYEPIQPQFRHQLNLIVRSSAEVSAIAPGIHDIVQRLDPRLAIEVTPVMANIEAWQQRATLVTTLSIASGLLALALAAVGIHGVVAFVVARRSKELGVRIALGAGVSRVLGLILVQTLRPVVSGAAAGLLVAAASTALLSSVLFGISPLDPIAIVGALAFLLAVALLASLPAARRALRVDPMTAIRYE